VTHAQLTLCHLSIMAQKARGHHHLARTNSGGMLRDDWQRRSVTDEGRDKLPSRMQQNLDHREKIMSSLLASPIRLQTLSTRGALHRTLRSCTGPTPLPVSSGDTVAKQGYIVAK
jgi:hypothetical protein